MSSEAEIIDGLATWIRGNHATKVAALQLPMGASSEFIRKAVDIAGAEAVWLSMGGVAGVDIASAAKCPIAVTFKKKVIIVNEFDAIVSNDPTTFLHITAAIKINKVPVVLVGNSFRSKASELPKGHAFFHLAGDPHMPRGCDTTRDKGLEGAEQALKGIDHAYRGDGIALGGVFDNYLGAIESAALPPAATLEAAGRIAEAFSESDVVSEGLRRGGAFDDPYSFVPVSTAARVFANTQTIPKIVTFGTVWSKTNAMYAKTNSTRVITKSIMEGGSRQDWKPEAGIDYVRLMVHSALARGDVDAAADVATRAGLSSAALLAVMRLWKSKYTLSTHGKIKKLLES